jgi:hypothetical protein
MWIAGKNGKRFVPVAAPNQGDREPLMSLIRCAQIAS